MKFKLFIASCVIGGPLVAGSAVAAPATSILPMDLQKPTMDLQKQYDISFVNRTAERVIVDYRISRQADQKILQANSKELLPKMAPGDAKVTFRLPTGGRTTLCQIRVTLNPDGTVSSPMYQIGDSGVCGVDVSASNIQQPASGKSGRNTVKVQFIVEKAAMNLNNGEIMNINTSN